MSDRMYDLISQGCKTLIFSFCEKYDFDGGGTIVSSGLGLVRVRVNPKPNATPNPKPNDILPNPNSNPNRNRYLWRKKPCKGSPPTQIYPSRVQLGLEHEDGSVNCLDNTVWHPRGDNVFDSILNCTINTRLSSRRGVIINLNKSSQPNSKLLTRCKDANTARFIRFYLHTLVAVPSEHSHGGQSDCHCPYSPDSKPTLTLTQSQMPSLMRTHLDACCSRRRTT